ncbi:MAG: DUF2849 domain-containing protein [Hyphomicrobiales bacterium]|nr:DUF2849 domain-containing protein [Hyphomicrobiales bacterium]
MATPLKRTPLPAILIANDLRIGDVVFWSQSGWTRDPAAALVAHDQPAADALDAAATAGMARQEVVDAYLIDVDVREGVPVPRHFRERFKTLGPSVHPELGKQAQFAAYARAAAE